MAEDALSTAELVDLVRRVFAPREDDRGLLVLIDLPDEDVPDHGAWAVRREMAADWARRLDEAKGPLGLARVGVALYRNVKRPNQELPSLARLHGGGPLPRDAASLKGAPVPFEELFAGYDIFLAPTEFSATAPLKNAARRHGFRAATMPGLAPAMFPALRLDWTEVDARCRALKERLDAADAARFVFEAAGQRHELLLDLRFRTAHASGGLLHERGTAGNLPSGESYVAPYEGERDGAPSRSAGTLPLELDGELVVYRIEGNRVVEVGGSGPAARAERHDLAAEPAYGNVAELGLGILRDYGIGPIGELLLDEKLGLHIAFGRSDHLGGVTGPDAWHDPSRVVHIDRVFIPEVMPRVAVRELDLVAADGAAEPLMRDGVYVRT